MFADAAQDRCLMVPNECCKSRQYSVKHGMLHARKGIPFLVGTLDMRGRAHRRARALFGLNVSVHDEVLQKPR
jgi:hypothetical protein